MTDAAVIAKRDASLKLANAARLHHARLCLLIGDMPRDQAIQFTSQLITSPTGHEQTLRVDKLLRALPVVGPITTRLMMRHAGLVGPRRLRDLTPHQRKLLIEALTLPPSEMRRHPPEAVVSDRRLRAAAAAIQAWRPDVADPREVAEIVLASDDERAAA